MSSSLHPNPALHSANPYSSSPSPPTQSHGGVPTSSPSPPTQEGAYDGDTLSPTITGHSSPAAGGNGGGCVLEQEANDDVTPSKSELGQLGAPAEDDDAMLHPPEIQERPSYGRSPSSRLRATARALEAANILSLSSAEDWDTRPPGIDPRRVDVPDLKCQCVMQVAEWSEEKIEFSVLTNKEGNGELEGFLERGRPEWAKVRWIHVNGLDWFGFHRSRRDEEAIIESTTSLSLPSVPTSAGNGSYIASPIPTAGSSTPVLTGQGAQGMAINPKSFSQYLRNLREAFKGVRKPREESARTLTHNRSGLSTRLRARAGGKTKKGAARRMKKDEDERAAARWTVAALTKDVKVHIHVEQLGIFLLRDGTVLSITQDAGYHRQLSQLFERLQSKDDLLRDSEDASFVLQALLDVTADDALEIAEEFREQLTTLESKVLSRADMEDVRHLHILSSQLLLLKSTLTPLQLLLQSLRAQDDAKAAAAFRLDPSTRPSSPAPGHGHGMTPLHQKKGFVSQEAKIYLGDVMDHVDSVLSSLELFGDLSENLIAFTFNQMSYSSNAYMQALSVISLVFLPATFLSSYFGMNFTTGDFPDELDMGVNRFWSIALPVSIITVILFGWEYLVQIFKAMRRNVLRVWHKVQVTRRRKDQ